MRQTPYLLSLAGRLSCVTVFAAVFAGRHVTEAEKYLGEMTLVVESAFFGDVADGFVGLGQKFPGPVDADGGDVCARRRVHDLYERPPKNRRAHA